VDVAELTRGILCVNAGSSSLKFAVHRPAGTVVLRGAVEDIGGQAAHLWLCDASETVVVDETRHVPDHRDATDRALAMLEDGDTGGITAVGHRIVHGGLRFVAPTLVDDTVLGGLRDLVELAPLHLPAQIAAVEEIAARVPALPQVACFDTAFHRRMPELAQRFALPEWAWDAGIRRFGFHGLSYEHVVDVLGPDCGRVVIAHLGNGASMAAVRDGEPVDTTMAFTPAAGLVMGTRAGDIDPGVIVHLLRDRGMDVDGVDRLVNRESGLLGISGTTADMRTLLEARSNDPAAARAVAMFCRSARKSIGALTAVLGGIDQLVFTGGIGERAPAVRAEICGGLSYLGIAIDSDRNDASQPLISARGTSCAVRIVPADEDRVIARHTEALAVAAHRAAPAISRSLHG
jgi:acetate kinase